MNFTEKLIFSLRSTARYDSGNFLPPEVILWPDPEKQWQGIIPQLRQLMPELLVFGNHSPEERTVPAIWLKCMVSKILPEASWPNEFTPIIYLPGFSKNDLKTSKRNLIILEKSYF